MSQAPKIAVYFEHPEWFKPLFKELGKRDVELVKIHANSVFYDPAQSQAEWQLLVNRMSPSSPTRGNANGIFFASNFFEHAEQSGVSVVNGTAAYQLEISKLRQALLMERLGIAYPRTVAVNRIDQVIRAADALQFPILTKANIGGSGAGIQLYRDPEQLRQAVDKGSIDFGLDRCLLLQEYHPADDGFIVRVEFLNGEFLYGIKVEADANAGFNLCPADVCELPVGSAADIAADAKAAEFDASFCPITAPAKRLIKAFEPPAAVIDQVLTIAKAGKLDVGGIEYLTSARDGKVYFYDINALSNFVGNAEELVGFDPHRRFVDYLLQRAAT